jgi:hypothetical protein
VVIWASSWLTRWEIGAVEPTQGQAAEAAAAGGVAEYVATTEADAVARASAATRNLPGLERVGTARTITPDDYKVS